MLVVINTSHSKFKSNSVHVSWRKWAFLTFTTLAPETVNVALIGVNILVSQTVRNRLTLPEKNKKGPEKLSRKLINKI